MWLRPPARHSILSTSWPRSRRLGSHVRWIVGATHRVAPTLIAAMVPRPRGERTFRSDSDRHSCVSRGSSGPGPGIPRSPAAHHGAPTRGFAVDIHGIAFDLSVTLSLSPPALVAPLDEVMSRVYWVTVPVHASSLRPNRPAHRRLPSPPSIDGPGVARASADTAEMPAFSWRRKGLSSCLRACGGGMDVLS
jgi:hypothetical protein